MRHKHKRMGIEKRIYKTNINQMLRYLTLIFYGVFGIGCIYAFLLIFCFSTFKIPSDSMEPQLQTGDQVLVNKWIAGPRLFNISASLFMGADRNAHHAILYQTLPRVTGRLHPDRTGILPKQPYKRAFGECGKSSEPIQTKSGSDAGRCLPLFPF